MPPQALALGAVLGWNFQRSRVGKSTISQFSRRHKAAFIVSWAALNLWLVPHIIAPSDRSSA